MDPGILFTIGAVFIWAFAFYWARHQHTPHEGYTRAFILATIYCLVSETIAIRLGKYHYRAFAFTIPAHWFSWLDWPLEWASTHMKVTLIHCVLPGSTTGTPLDVPLEIALFEAALLFSIYRVSHLLFPHVIDQGKELRPLPWMLIAAPMALLNGALAVNVDAILDPVVSGSQPCRMSDPGNLHKGFVSLWTWHTTANFRGYWFDIPLANYTAWFAALFAFSISVRVGRVVTVGLTGKTFRLQLFASLRALFFLVVILFAVKLSLDRVMYHGFGNISGEAKPAAWQFAVLGTVLVVSIVVGLIALMRGVSGHRLEWNVVAPQLFSFAYCLLSLVIWRVAARSRWMYPLFAFTLSVAAAHTLLAIWRSIPKTVADPTS